MTNVIDAVESLKRVQQRLNQELDTDTAEALNRAIRQLEYLSQEPVKKRETERAILEALMAIGQILQATNNIAEIVSTVWK